MGIVACLGLFWVVAVVVVADVAVCGVCGGGVWCKWWWWPFVILWSPFLPGTCRL